MQTTFKEVAKAIQEANRLLISTHQPCDGDGLGCELAFYHALRTKKKKVHIVHTAPVESFYHFLEGVEEIRQLKNLQQAKGRVDSEEKNERERGKNRGRGESGEGYEEHGRNKGHEGKGEGKGEGRTQGEDLYDLAIIFDTHEIKMLNELPPFLLSHCKKVIFVDHHQPQKTGQELAKALHPLPVSLYLWPEAASTGELAYGILCELLEEKDWNTQVARSLYTSIVFDTKMYRYIRNSPRSHEIVARLLKWPIESHQIHDRLFGNQSVRKIAFLSSILKKLEYFYDHQVVFVFISQKDLQDFSLQIHESKSIIELLMDIEPVEVAVTLTEQANGFFKMSLRSKGKVSVFSICQHFQGGGHLYAAGALLRENLEDIKPQILQQINLQMKR